MRNKRDLLSDQTTSPHDGTRMLRTLESDVLSEVLQDLGLRTRLFCHSALGAPWALRFAASTLAHFHYIERGGAWLRLAGDSSAVALGTGDVVVLPQGRAYVLSDAPQRRAVDFREVVPATTSGGCQRITHGGTGPVTTMVCGSFEFARQGPQPLFALLPPLLHLKADTEAAQWLPATLRQLAAEAREPRPGSAVAINRLCDVLLVQLLRAWLASPEAEASGASWLRGLADPRIAHALSLMHGDPTARWTVTTLAAALGLSRTPFASRFLAVVGETPMAYLQRLRLGRAAGQLERGRLSLHAAAELAGYGSDAAFSKAFRRLYGHPPGQHRRRRGAPTPPTS